MTSRLRLPPRTRTESGAERRVGVELELSGLTIARAAELVAEHLGARAEAVSPYESVIHGDADGEWSVELDFAYLKKRGRQQPEDEGELATMAHELLRIGAEQIVPVEVVSPPIPMSRLERVEGLVERLRAAGARGTTDALVYAFGMQLNPEMPATDGETIAAYLKAFLCLTDWLSERAQVDFSRRLTAFADPFPKAYARKVVDVGYWPERARLIDDYLAANPTRNRALDLLPLMLHVDEARVRAVTRDPRIKARPALHYRLPNCEIDRPGWGIHVAWNDWLEVERMAFDRARLERVCAAFARHLDRPLGALVENWAKMVETWLEPRPGR